MGGTLRDQKTRWKNGRLAELRHQQERTYDYVFARTEGPIMPSTSAQIPKKLHRRLSTFLAKAQVDRPDDRVTRLSFVSAGILGLPEAPDQLWSLWEARSDDLVLRRKTNPGVKRSFEMTEEAHQRFLELNAACVEHDVKLQKQQIITLAIASRLDGAS